VACLSAYAKEVDVDVELVVSAYVAQVRDLRRENEQQVSGWTLWNSRAGWWMTAAVLMITSRERHEHKRGGRQT
jgi:hypothetical protein